MISHFRYFIIISIFAGILLIGCTSSPTQASKPQNSADQNPITVDETTSTKHSSPNPEWQVYFDLENCTLSTEGRNDYFVLEPGFQLVLEGGNEKVAITVLNETIDIDGTMTRVLEEREWRNDEIIEISYNFFAFCEETQDVFYFGEDVDMFSDGVLSSHSGAWRAGVDDARAGLIMPGEPVVGLKY